MCWALMAGRPNGSSPRLRGTFSGRGHHGHKRRFIPAPAGNMGSNPRENPLVPVHPRACGEHSIAVVRRRKCSGSSPRLRGTYYMAGNANSGRRFIPAPAGNIALARRSLESVPVHPRACGEHYFLAVFLSVSVGSSPRLRGTFSDDDTPEGSERFIPAPAGNIVPAAFDLIYTAVHPRACGEHASQNQRCFYKPGSSPRLRGTSLPIHQSLRYGRFIPAPAGNICYARPGSQQPAVHPRACGEHCSTRPSAVPCIGSSPRLRGTSAHLPDVSVEQRFIPAPAGNIQ